MNYSKWEIDLKAILEELSKGRIPYIETASHNYFVFRPDGTSQAMSGTHYLANIDGQAYVEELNGVNKEMQCDYVMEFINLLIRYVPYYSPFEEKTLMEYQIHKSADAIRLMVERDNTLMAETFIYLLDYGYATWRTDIKYDNTKGVLYAELTDKGRKLKESGSIEAFYAGVKESERMEARQIARDENLYWIQFWIAVGVIAAGAYYLLEILRVQYHLGLPHHVFFP